MNGELSSPEMAVRKKASEVESFISLTLGQDPSSPLVILVEAIQQSQSKTGRWSDFPYALQNTALAISLLYQLYEDINTTWVVETHGGIEQYGSIRKAVDWLLSQRRPTGEWSDVFWVDCQIVKTFMELHLEDVDLTPTVEHLRKVIAAEWEGERENRWFGAGSIAAGIELFTRLAEPDIVGTLMPQISSFQHEDGFFIGPQYPGGLYKTTPLWHTSQSLLSLRAAGLSSKSSIITKAHSWLTANQSSEGSWWHTERSKPFYTAWCLMACCAVDGRNSAPAHKAIQWFESQVSNTAQLPDIDNMISMGLACTEFYDEPRVSIPLDQVAKLRDVINRQQIIIDEYNQEILSLGDNHQTSKSQIDALTSDNESLLRQTSTLVSEQERLKEELTQARNEASTLSNQLKEYWFKLTERQVATLGLIFGALGIALAIWQLVINR